MSDSAHPRAPVHVKICGVNNLSDALMCVEAGADAIGLNFWPGTPRYCGPSVARDIADRVRGRIELVGVFVDAQVETIIALREDLGLDWVQLHGAEPPSTLQALLPKAFKALRGSGRSVLARAATYGGQHLLVDAAHSTLPGGTGQTADWETAAQLAKERLLTLAGGLRPDNIIEAVQRVEPYRVDVASGVEAAPGRKAPLKTNQFVERAKRAYER